jgi:hypothetical protein
MDSFSKRYKYDDVKEIQLESINDDLRNRIWNTISEKYVTRYSNLDRTIRETEWKSIFHGFFKIPIESVIDSRIYYQIPTIKQFYYSLEWNRIFDLLEFILMNTEKDGHYEEFIDQINLDLEEENSAYRIIENLVVPITNKEEIKEIEVGLTQQQRISEHLRTALVHLSSKDKPDYRNSIKESISAVEATCQLINNSRDTLGDALNKLKKLGLGMPEALARGFNNIYGYTNSNDGIRHAMMDVPTLNREDAHFMLIACSAFVNYLLSKYAKIK